MAAEQGFADAQSKLGFMYQKGKGVPQDYAEAMKWYRKAAKQGLRGAQYNLGVMYGNGLGVPQDYAEAVKWYRKAEEGFRKAAEQGDAKAQYFLGVMYDKGQGVPQDYAEAVRWYRKAAEQGDAAQAVKGLLTGRKKDRLPSKLAKVATEVSRRDGAWRGPRCGQRNPGIALGV